MLHRKDPAGLICITQPNHAWVAGQLARVWGNEDFGSVTPWEEVCLGAEQHDIGWSSWEQSPTLNSKTGFPHNFLEVPTPVHLRLWSAAKDLALPWGRYVALLISLHGTGLYERYRSWEKSPELTQLVQDFFKSQKTFQAKLTDDLQDDPYYASYTTPEVIERNRQLITIWDALSITFCLGLGGEQQMNDVPTAEGRTTLKLTPVENDSSQVTVEPWPFGLSTVTLVYEGRLLKETFTAEEAMQAALSHASWVTLSTTLKPA